MDLLPVNQSIKDLLSSRLNDLEKHLNADVLYFYGSLGWGVERVFLKMIEELADDKNKNNALYVVLTTTGGSAEIVERCVNVIRHHYPNEVNFIVPNCAYSAGTIFCMSGDNILMDYYSVLGPIDPQIINKEGAMVAALGYLDKINELIIKAKNGQITQAEFIILKEFDLAELRAYEQAKELTIDLLKKWLVKYKFKTWNKHKDGRDVTSEEKVKRAEEIADKLSDSNIWKSHGRPINITILRELKLKINDFGEDKKLSSLIRAYDTLAVDYINKNNYPWSIHTRRGIL